MKDKNKTKNEAPGENEINADNKSETIDKNNNYSASEGPEFKKMLLPVIICIIILIILKLSGF